MTQFNVALDTARSRNARQRLEMRFQTGTDVQRRLLERVAALVIRDKMIPPKKMFFSIKEVPRIHLGSPEEQGAVIHPHALGQLCERAGVPRTFINRLIVGKPWEKDLAKDNLETLFLFGEFLDRSKKPTKFLGRFVGSGDELELRGFLSRNYARHLASLPMLRGFVHACDTMGAKPVEASSSATRFGLKCFLPYVFEPVINEFIAFGVSWSNSDFGSGRLKVSLCSQRVSSGTTAILEDNWSRVHIGSVIQESDLELSSDTMAKEVDAQVAAECDAVTQLLKPEAIDRLLLAIELAHKEKVPWHRIKAELGRLLHKKEVEGIAEMLKKGDDDIVDLPPVGRTEDGSPIATRWWASSVVSHLADKEQSLDRQSELQRLAGDILKAK